MKFGLRGRSILLFEIGVGTLKSWRLKSLTRVATNLPRSLIRAWSSRRTAANFEQGAMRYATAVRAAPSWATLAATTPAPAALLGRDYGGRSCGEADGKNHCK